MDPITTLDEWNAHLLAGGCCSMPSCLRPLENYKQATISATGCSFSMPEHPNVPDELKCAWFASREITSSDITNQTDLDLGDGVLQDYTTQTSSHSLETQVFNALDCSISLMEYESSGYTTNWIRDDGVDTTNDRSEYATTKTDGDCYYTDSFTDYMDSGNNTSSGPDVVTCPPEIVGPTITEEFSYADLSFTYESEVPPNDFTTQTVNLEVTYSTRIDVPYLLTKLSALNYPDDFVDFGNGYTSWPAHTDGIVSGNCTQPTSVTEYRVQFKVKSLDISGNPFTGTYLKFMFDVIEEPDEWNSTIDDPDYVPPGEEPEDGWPPIPQVPNPDAPKRTFHATDVIREWTGPGAGAQTDTSWNLGSVYVLTPPDVLGQRRIVNRRWFILNGSPYGVMPQADGDVVRLPDLPQQASMFVKAGNSGDAGDTGTSGKTALSTGKLRITGLQSSGLKSSSGLKLSGLSSSGLKIGGLKTSGFKNVQTRASGGLKTSGIRTSGLRSGGLRSGGLRAGKLR